MSIDQVARNEFIHVDPDVIASNHHAIVGIYHNSFMLSIKWLKQLPPHSVMYHMMDELAKSCLAKMDKIYSKSGEYYRQIYQKTTNHQG